jgi:carbohydrate kinase (thermoresistant glucokinase family)
MAAGTPLEDADRWPWLERLNRELHEHNNAVLACSALKDSYRQVLCNDVVCRIVHLRGTFDLLRSRLEARQHRYMPASLLESQFATLEAPADAIDIDVARPVDECVAAILAQLPMCT